MDDRRHVGPQGAPQVKGCRQVVPNAALIEAPRAQGARNHCRCRRPARQGVARTPGGAGPDYPPGLDQAPDVEAHGLPAEPKMRAQLSAARGLAARKAGEDLALRIHPRTLSYCQCIVNLHMFILSTWRGAASALSGYCQSGFLTIVNCSTAFTCPV